MNVQDIGGLPVETTGRWIAWSRDHKQIVAVEKTLARAKSASLAAGERDPVFEKVPRADAWFVGAMV